MVQTGPRFEGATSEAGVYLIVNVCERGYYVGSAVNIARRWRDHVSRLRRGEHETAPLQSAWRRFGEVAFEFHVLEAVSDLWALHRREQYWIDTFSRDPEGPMYNVSSVVHDLRVGLATMVNNRLGPGERRLCLGCGPVPVPMVFVRTKGGSFLWVCPTCGMSCGVHADRLFAWVKEHDGVEGVRVRRREGVPY